MLSGSKVNDMKKTDRAAHSRFSFPLTTLAWDGERITRVPDAEWRKDLETLQRAGVKEVMLSGYTEVEKADFDLDKEAGRIGEILRAEGMPVSQHHTVAACFAPGGDSQREVTEKLKRQVDVAVKLGSPVMVFHPGRALGKLSSAEELIEVFEKESGRIGFTSLLHLCAENLHEAGEYAKSCRTAIALENVDRFEPLGGLESLPSLIDSADSEGIGFCLDTGHAWCCGTDPVSYLDVLGNHLLATHIHDNHGMKTDHGNCKYFRSFPDDEHLAPGFGTIDFFAVIRAMHRNGYSGTINFETGPWPGCGTEGYRSIIRFWRTCEMLALK